MGGRTIGLYKILLGWILDGSGKLSSHIPFTTQAMFELYIAN